MARLASQEKLGYYKTPVCVVEQIREGLCFESNIRMLDPCCGTGEALRLLADNTGAHTLGIELEKGRYEQAREVLDQVLLADSLAEAMVSYQSIDVLWLNPPYDLDEGDFSQNRERFELLFLQKYLPVLVQNGLLIFIVALRELCHASICGLLARLLDLEIYRFPDEQFERFQQVVVIGRKRVITGLVYEQNYQKIMSLRLENIPTTETIRPKAIRVENTETRRELIFSANHIDPAEILPLTAALRETFLKDITPPKLTDAHPLMPLRQGHLAMLLAAGYVNGELSDGNGEHLVIKGTVRKKQTIMEESTEEFTITRTIEKVEITVRALNLSSGEIETIS